MKLRPLRHLFPRRAARAGSLSGPWARRLYALLLCAPWGSAVVAQYVLGPDETPRVEAVQLHIHNPGDDATSV